MTEIELLRVGIVIDEKAALDGIEVHLEGTDVGTKPREPRAGFPVCQKPTKPRPWPYSRNLPGRGCGVLLALWGLMDWLGAGLKSWF